MIFKKLKNNIYLVIAPRYQLAKLFCRFQEHYESPKFRGKVFTLDELKLWYSKGKKFTYYSDWSGFNVPGHSLNSFFTGEFNPLTKEELWLISKINKVAKGEYQRNQIYIIGVSSVNSSTFRHEVCHALFGTNFQWRTKTLSILNSPKVKRKTLRLRKYLKKLGYHKSVITDEVHAYLLNDYLYLKHSRIWNKELEEISIQLMTELGKVLT